MNITTKQMILANGLAAAFGAQSRPVEHPETKTRHVQSGAKKRRVKRKMQKIARRKNR